MEKYGDKEIIYDENIAPLMSKIISICKENDINMVASFQLQSENETDNGEHFLCTTLLPNKKDHYPEQYSNFCNDIYRRPSFVAMTIREGE
jgi:hypothetical protein